MKEKRVKVIANFKVSIEYKDDSYSCYSTTNRLWSDEDGQVTEGVVEEWEKEIKESVFKKDYTVYECNVICTSFFKLDNK